MEDEMSISELAAMFNEPIPVEPPHDENSIYMVSGRIKNYCSFEGLVLTDQGTALCNVFTHTLMSFYKISETLPEPYKMQLIGLIREQEKATSNYLIYAYKGKK